MNEPFPPNVGVSKYIPCPCFVLHLFLFYVWLRNEPAFFQLHCNNINICCELLTKIKTLNIKVLLQTITVTAKINKTFFD